MRFALPVIPTLVVAMLLGACDYFSDPDNRPPRIAVAQMFVADVSEDFEVRLLVTAVDADGNLDGVDCTGDLSYQGASPVDITVSFPLSMTGERVGSRCVASDTEGLQSSALDLILTLPDSTAATPDTTN